MGVLSEMDNSDNDKDKIKKEKEKILKGSYKDRFKIDNKDPLSFYDMIIDIDSFSKKPEIEIKIQKKTKAKKSEAKEESKEDKKINNNNQINKNKIPEVQLKEKLEEKSEENEDIVLGVIGLGNVGKTYLLSILTGEELPIGYTIHTKGISIKKTKKLIILDSQGIEAPLTKINISKDLYPKDNLLNKDINESDNEIQNIVKDKKAVELFIQDFIIDKSNILFIVVGQLTLSEQKLIYRVANQTNKTILYVIHNLKNLYSREQINDYIENTFKKNIFLNFETFSEEKYKSGKTCRDNNQLEEYNKYYIEKYRINEKSEKVVIHLIMASNLIESEGYYYNKTVIDYIRTEIYTFNNGQKFNIIEELKKYIIEKGEKYVESEENLKPPFSKEDIIIDNPEEPEGDIKTIKIKNKTVLKKCLINQLGFFSFYGALYSPNYVCYLEEGNNKKEKKFIVDINLCGNYDIKNPKRQEITEGVHKYIITFLGTKTLREYKNIEVLNDDMDSGNFRIDIVLDCNKYKFKPNEKVKKEKKKGIVRFIYTILNDDNNINNNSETKVEDFNFPKKENPSLKKDK